jgi:catechol-2,3-dioxygenase
MPAKVIKLGFLGLNVLKAGAMSSYYENVLGLPRSADCGQGEAYFVCGSDHHAVSFHASETPATEAKEPAPESWLTVAYSIYDRLRHAEFFA